MAKIDVSAHVYLNALVDGYEGLRITFTDADGFTWSGIAWKDKSWSQDKQLIDVERANEPEETIET